MRGRIGYGAAYPSPMGFSAGCSFPPSVYPPSKSLAQLTAPASHVMVMDAVPSGPSSRPLWEQNGFYMNVVHSPFMRTEWQHYGFNVAPGFPPAFHQRPHGRHAKQVNVVFADGHTKATPSGGAVRAARIGMRAQQQHLLLLGGIYPHAAPRPVGEVGLTQRGK